MSRAKRQTKHGSAQGWRSIWPMRCYTGRCKSMLPLAGRVKRQCCMQQRILIAWLPAVVVVAQFCHKRPRRIPQLPEDTTVSAKPRLRSTEASTAPKDAANDCYEPLPQCQNRSVATLEVVVRSWLTVLGIQGRREGILQVRIPRH